MRIYRCFSVLALTLGYLSGVTSVAAKGRSAKVAKSSTEVQYKAILPKDRLLPLMTIGSTSAKIVFDHYGSASCEPCSHWMETVWPSFKAKYVDTGKVRYVFHEVLTHDANYDALTYRLARCIVKNSDDPTNSKPYFEALWTMFDGYAEVKTTGDQRPVVVEVFAKIPGMQQERVAACASDSRETDSIVKNMLRDTKIGAGSSVPRYYLNGALIHGASMEGIDGAVQLLGGAR